MGGPPVSSRSSCLGSSSARQLTSSEPSSSLLPTNMCRNVVDAQNTPVSLTCKSAKSAESSENQSIVAGVEVSKDGDSEEARHTRAIQTTGVTITGINKGSTSLSSDKNMWGRIALGRSDVVSERWRSIVSDTGCNCVVLAPETVQLLHLQVQSAPPGFQLQFGDAAGRVTVESVVNGGALLGMMAVVPRVVENLGGITIFTRRQMIVVYDQDCVRVIDRNGRLLITGQFDVSKGLYYFDLKQLIETSLHYVPPTASMPVSLPFESPSLPPDLFSLSSLLRAGADQHTSSIETIEEIQGGVSLDARALYATRKRAMKMDGDSPCFFCLEGYMASGKWGGTALHAGAAHSKPVEGRLLLSEIRLVREVHNRTAHLAPNTLADSIDDRVLDGLPEGLTGALVRKVNKHGHQCAVCEAARRKKEDIPVGSGGYPGTVGSFASFDELGPISPPAASGEDTIF